MDFRLMHKSEINDWYEHELCEAFSENERKPLCDILDLIDGGRYELLGLFDNEQLLGYAAVWKAPDIPLELLDYLGVTRRRRSAGLGSNILSQLKKRMRPMIVESELPIEDDDGENGIRLRRIAFYERNGFTPVYHMATCGIRWQTLLKDDTGAALPDIMAWHRALYGARRTDVIVPLAAGEQPPIPYWMQRGSPS